MENVFEEWNMYVDSKSLITRAPNLKGIQASAKLKLIALSGIRRSEKTIFIFHKMTRNNLFKLLS